MLSGGKLPEGPVAPCEVSVGFIQVCRNSLRSYEKSWKSLGKESYLKSIFNSGIAFYVFPGCPTIDMVVPLRITKGTTTEHIPMFVSIKCRAYGLVVGRPIFALHRIAYATNNHGGRDEIHPVTRLAQKATTTNDDKCGGRPS